MSERENLHAGESMVGPHGAADDHGDDHGHDDHAHDGDALGPFDIQAWSMAVLGVLLGLVVAIALLQAGS